ncbi:arsenate reductase [Runella sp.]|jgi:arsenate reductase|uniref:arsenate reductase n=1 Tax=Runella sp. TaxID=1960881 RepID=UPI0026128CA0|nr:arsenate reductase [Runella sp.]
MLIVYGIPNCDTVKKTLNWFKANGTNYQFHDYKKQGITREKLENWLGQTNWTTLLNRAGTTFKNLSEEQKATIQDADSALAFLLENTSAIKRPVVERDGQIIKIGWKPEGI